MKRVCSFVVVFSSLLGLQGRRRRDALRDPHSRAYQQEAARIAAESPNPTKKKETSKGKR